LSRLAVNPEVTRTARLLAREECKLLRLTRRLPLE